jgi:outer membrane protein W
MLVASFPVLAEEGDMIIRFGLVYSSPTGDLVFEDSEPPYLFRDQIEADSGVGGFAGFEYMVTDLVGLDGTLLFVNHDVDVLLQEFMDGELVYEDAFNWGDTVMMPVLFSAHFHVMQKDAFDLYVGPSVGYVNYADLELSDDGELIKLNLDKDFGYGFVVGLDRPMGGGGWAFHSAFRYLATTAELNDSELREPWNIDIDPWMIQAGAAKRW